MKQIVTIRLGHYILNIDSDANSAIENYSRILHLKYDKEEGGADIIADIEERIGELLKHRQEAASVEFSTMEDVKEVIRQMGMPEDMENSTAGAAQTFAPGSDDMSKKLFRDPKNRVIAGVSSGLGAYFNVDPVWVRLAFVAFTILGGFAFPVYIVLWIVMPIAHSTAERLRMHGQVPTLKNIEEKVKSEFNETANSLRRQDYASPVAEFFKVIGKIIAVIFRIFVIFMASIGIIACGVFIASYFSGAIHIDGDIIGMHGREGVNQALSLFGDPGFFKVMVFVFLTLFIASLVLTIIPKGNRGRMMHVANVFIWLFIIMGLAITGGYTGMRVDELHDREDDRLESSKSFMIPNDKLNIRFENPYKEKDGLFSQTRIYNFDESPDSLYHIEQYSSGPAIGHDTLYSLKNNELVLQRSFPLRAKTLSDFPEVHFKILVPKNHYVNMKRHRHWGNNYEKYDGVEEEWEKHDDNN